MTESKNSTAKPLGFFDANYHLLRRLHSLSGIVPIGVFLIAHLLTNSSIVWGLFDPRKKAYGHGGVATFQHEVDFIHSIPFLLIIEISLWGAIAFHTVLGFYYAFTGKTNTSQYSFGGNWRYRLQRLTGYLGIFFIIYHVGTLRWGWTFLIPGGTSWSAEYAASTMAAALRGGMNEFTGAGLIVASAYMLGVTALVFHFANGLWTAAITWGLTISESAQRRWGYACAAFGIGMMALGWSAVIGFAVTDPKEAKATELRFHQSKTSVITGDKNVAGMGTGLGE